MSPALCRLCLVSRAQSATELIERPIPDGPALLRHYESAHGVAEPPAHITDEVRLASALGFAATTALEWGLPIPSVDRAALAALSILQGRAVQLPDYDLGNLTQVHLLAVPDAEAIPAPAPGSSLSSLAGTFVGALRWPLYRFTPGDAWSDEYVTEKLVGGDSRCDGASLALTLAIALRGVATVQHRCRVHYQHVPGVFSQAFEGEVAP